MKKRISAVLLALAMLFTTAESVSIGRPSSRMNPHER